MKKKKRLRNRRIFKGVVCAAFAAVATWGASQIGFEPVKTIFVYGVASALAGFSIVMTKDASKEREQWWDDLEKQTKRDSKEASFLKP